VSRFRGCGPYGCVLLLAGLLGGCAGISGGQRPPVVEEGVYSGQVPAEPAGREGGFATPPAPVTAQPSAVVALLDRAQSQANAGDLDAASATLERAIRIDSRNPVLWHHLATVRLAEEEFAQAEQLAAKSNSLAAGNHALQARNWRLIAEARRRRGDTAGAGVAEQRARALGTD